MGTKLKVIVQRAESKDYSDMAAKASGVFPIPSMEKISDQLSDDDTVLRANRDRGGLEL